jgi:hypothetical protein
MGDAIQRYYKGLREELDMARHQQRQCEFNAPEWIRPVAWDLRIRLN